MNDTYSFLFIVATDPITHSLPETKLVRSQSVRHYKEAWGKVYKLRQDILINFIWMLY